MKNFYRLAVSTHYKSSAILILSFIHKFYILIAVQLIFGVYFKLLCKLVYRVAIATRFQRDFMQLLYDAQFEELSARDLMLTSALNTDYLLTLPIYVDWKKASESNAIIFR